MHEEDRINKFLPLMQSLYKASQEKLGFKPHAKIVIIKNGENMENPLGKTAHYSPGEYKIGLYTQGRHIKDILRSLSHELVHHNQNCRGDFDSGAATVQGYAQEDGHLREMEREAYEHGNMIFRDWEDKMKEKGAKPLFTSTNQYVPAPTSDVVSGALLEEKDMKNNIVESQLRNIIRGVIQEMFDDDIKEADNMGMPANAESQEAAEEEAEKAGGQVGAVYKGVEEGHDYDVKGTPLDDPRNAKDPERYEKGKVGGKVFEDSEGEETYHYGEDEGEDERRLKDDDLTRSHRSALRKDMAYDEEHEDRHERGTHFRESFFPQGRSTREKARYELNDGLMKRWGYTKKEK